MGAAPLGYENIWTMVRFLFTHLVFKLHVNSGELIHRELCYKLYYTTSKAQLMAYFLEHWFPKSSMGGENHISLCRGRAQQQHNPHDCTAAGGRIGFHHETRSTHVFFKKNMFGGKGSLSEGFPALHRPTRPLALEAGKC